MAWENKVAFVGDPHLQFSNPTSRIDNYFMAVINKLKQVLDENKYVVILGDLFSNPVLDIEGMIVLISILRKHQQKGGKVYTIVGNHDIYSWQIQTITKTSLGLIHKLGLIEILDRSGQVKDSLDKIELKDWTIIPGLLNTPKELTVAPTTNSILVSHSYYAFERDKKHSLEYEDLKELGYKYIFLGHDHERYKTKLVEGSSLYRPGSLGREAAHPYNFTREIIYYQLDLGTGKVEPVDVEFEPASEVFSLEVIEKHNDQTPKYVYDMEELMKNFKNKSTVNISIKKLMEDNPEIPDSIIDFIEECYEACGLDFV